jgi:hypothetical protein
MRVPVLTEALQVAIVVRDLETLESRGVDLLWGRKP